MKIGFSTICCPTWDLKTIFEQVVRLGYDGIELRVLQGELHLPNHPDVAQNGDVLLEVCEKTKVDLVCLGSSASFGTRDKHIVADQKAQVREYVELAHRLRCPFVRVFTGDIPSGSSRDDTLGRSGEVLRDLAQFAGKHNVTLLVENSGDLSDSKDLWFLLDSVSHPALQACWNPINGRSVGDQASVAIPRLSSRLGMVHVTDATFEGLSMQGYQPLGEGNMGIARLVELLTGLVFGGYLMLEWPKLWNDSLADAGEVLPQASQYLRGLLSVERKPLPAYKGDKNATEFEERRQRIPARPGIDS